MRRSTLRTIALPAFAGLVAGCSDGGGPSSDTPLNFSLATRAVAPAVVGSAGASLATTASPETYTDGTNTLVLNSVQLVLREIELKPVETSTTCADAAGQDDCEELKLGPILLDLPLGTAGATRVFSVQVAAGTYGEVEFEIHKPSSSDDAVFVQAHPDFDGVSIRATGTYNGTDFTFTTPLDAEEEIELSPPLVVGQSAATDLTLFVNLDTWFRDQAGSLVDPASANVGQPNEGLVQENIKKALEAFEDENHDGSDDTDAVAASVR